MTKYVATGLLALTLFSAAPALAAETSTDFTAKCEAREAKIAANIADHDAKHADHEEKYSAHLDRLNTLADSADAAGVDSAALRSDIAQLESLHNQFLTDRETLETDMNALSSIDCSAADQSSVRDQVATAKTARQTVFADVKAMIDFVKGTLRPEVQSVHGQVTPDTTNS